MRRLLSTLLLALACALVVIPLAGASGVPSASADQGADASAGNAQLLQIIKNDMARAGSGRIGVAVKFLPTGQTAYWNADKVYESASLYKVFVMYEAFRQERAGAISFSNRMVITQAIADVNGGYSPVPIGSSLSISQALELMITVSDNASAVALRQRLGVNSINASIKSRLGLTETQILYDSVTSPRDMLRFFDGLSRLAYLDVDASKEMMRLLLAQQDNDRIPAGLPKYVWVAHKTGELDGVRNDAGIVYSPAGPIIIAIVDDHTYNLSALISAEVKLSSDIYNYAMSGKFGKPTSAPFLYDPELETALKPSLAAAGGKISLAVQQLDTGQGTLDSPATAWPLATGFDPDRLADPRAVRARRAEPEAECGDDSECLAALSQSVSAAAFKQRVSRGDLDDGLVLRQALERAQKAGGIVAKIPADDVVAYLDSRVGGTIKEVAVIRSSSGLYVVSSSAPTSVVAQLVNVGSAIQSYFAGCVWGHQSNPQACSGS